MVPVQLQADIKADGSVVFEGREFVKQKGIVKSQISQEQLRALLVEFDRIKFFSLRDKYISVEDGCEVLQRISDNDYFNSDQRQVEKSSTLSRLQRLKGLKT